MKILKVLIPVLLIGAAGFLLFKNQKNPSPSSDITAPSPSPSPSQPGGFNLPKDFPPFPGNPSEPEGVLLISDDSSKGNLMLQLDEPIGSIDSSSKVETTYIRTSRDYSAFIGKRVMAKLKAGTDPLDFVLEDIVPLE